MDVKEKFYKYIETQEVKSKPEWNKFYQENINHNSDDCGYPTFDDWLFDMLKMGLLVEVEDEERKMNKFLIDFGNLPMELKNKRLKLFFRKVTEGGLYIQDEQNNVYEIEGYWWASYLDEMIRDKVVVEFNLVDKNEIEDWEKEIWTWNDVEFFIERQRL